MLTPSSPAPGRLGQRLDEVTLDALAAKRESVKARIESVEVRPDS
jgi:hypothetical protein